MSNPVIPNALEEFIETDPELGDMLNDLDLAPARFPFSQDYIDDLVDAVDAVGAEDAQGKIKTGITDSNIERPPLPFNIAFDNISAAFTGLHPDMLFQIEQFPLMDANPKDPYRDFYIQESLDEIRQLIGMFLVSPNQFENTRTLELSHRSKFKKFDLSVTREYFPDSRFEMVVFELTATRKDRHRKLPFERVVMVVNNNDTKDYQGVFYITNNDFDSNLPTPFLAAIDLTRLNDLFVRICRTVTNKERDGLLSSQRDQAARANNRHYSVIALARIQKILGLAIGSDLSRTYE